MIERKTIKTEYGPINFLERIGDKPILLIHGGFGNAPDLMMWANHALPYYRLIVPFLPGHGSYDLNDSNYQNFLKSISQFTDKLKINDYVLWGHSFGGRVSYDLLNQYNAKPAKVVLIAPVLAPINEKISNMAYGVLKDYLNDLRLTRVLSREGVPIATYTKNFKNIWKILTGLGPIEPTSFNISSLLIWGTHDSVVPLSDNRKLALAIKPQIYKEFPGGHFNFFARSEIAKLLNQFSL